MTYIVNYTNDSKNPILISNKELNTSTSLKLLGKNYPGYGEIIAENLVHILESFANSIPPENPIEGQLWYNPNNEIVSVYTSSGEWKSLGNVNIENTNPQIGSTSSPGNIWVNSLNNRVFVYTGSVWLEIATFVDGNGIFLKTRFDSQNNIRNVLEIYLNFEIVAIISLDSDTWIPQAFGSTTEFIFDSGIKLQDQFPTIKNGVNLNFSKVTGINSNGTIEGNIIKGNLAEGNWIATPQEVTNVNVATNNKIMTPATSDLLFYNRLTTDNAYRATQQQAIKSPFEPGGIVNDRVMTPFLTNFMLSHRTSNDENGGGFLATLGQATTNPYVTNRLMSPFLTRKAYENYVDGKISYNVYQQNGSPLNITTQNSWVTLLSEPNILAYQNRPIFYSFHVSYYATSLTRLEFRLRDTTNNITAQTIEWIYGSSTSSTGMSDMMSGAWNIVPTSNQTITLQLQVFLVGTSINAIPSHLIQVSRAFELL